MIITVQDALNILQSLPPTTPIKADNVPIQTIKIDANGVAQVSIASSAVEAD